MDLIHVHVACERGEYSLTGWGPGRDMWGVLCIYMYVCMHASKAYNYAAKFKYHIISMRSRA
jgi:hypothetical protein